MPAKYVACAARLQLASSCVECSLQAVINYTTKHTNAFRGVNNICSKLTAVKRQS